MKHELQIDKTAQQGVVLVEAMVAILIFSVGVLAIAGLQAAMVKNTSDSKFRADASFVAQQQIGRMWANPLTIGDYLGDAIDVSSQLPGGVMSVAQSGVQYTITVSWQQPGEEQHSFTTTARIVGNE